MNKINMNQISAFLPLVMIGVSSNTLSYQLEEIIVTVQKRSESLQDVPIAVTALTSNDLMKANIDGHAELERLTPNLTISTTSTLAAPYLRGIGTQYALPGLDSSIAVYVDGVYRPRSLAGIFSFNDIERIEVLKGPQGTLYGRNATGGAINIVTKDPHGDFASEVSVTSGTDDRLALDGMLNIPMGEKMSLRVAGRHDESDGFTNNLAPNASFESFGKDEDIFTAKLLLEPSENWRIILSGDYSSKEDREGNAFANLYPGAPEQVGAALGGCVASGFYDVCDDNPFTANDVEDWGGSLFLEYNFDTAILSSTTAIRRQRESNCANNDATGSPFQHTCGEPYTDQFSQEFVLTSNLSGRFNYTAGLYYLTEDTGYPIHVSGLSIDGAFGSLFGIVPAAFIGDGDVETESIAPFVEVNYEISEKLSLTAGLRYTDEEKKLIKNAGIVAPLGNDGFGLEDSAIRAPLGPCLVSGQVLCEAMEDKNNFQEWSPKLTLSYRPSDETMMYLTYSKGFKSGGYNLPAFGSVDSVDSETLDNFEFGWKYQQSNIRFNGAIFYYDYSDLQVQIINPQGGGARVQNAAEATLWGGEADFAWSVTDRFEIGAGVGYVDTEYDNFDGDQLIPSSGTTACAAAAMTPDPADDVACLGLTQITANHKGNELTNTPGTTGFLTGSYLYPLNDLGSLEFSATVNYRGSSFYDAANAIEEDSRTMLSARVTWTSPAETMFVTLSGKNLTDEKYDVARAPLATGGFRIAGAPRQIYGTVGLKF